LWHIKTVMANQELSALDSELKKVALTTFLFSLLVAVAL
jgi:1,4-dihydroxy-2-naphthoate octaprenyltransferase